MNKIGLIICIETENDKQKIRIKNDFVRRINSLIDNNQINDTVNVIHLNMRQTKHLNEVLYNYSRNKAHISKSRLIEGEEKSVKKFRRIQSQIQGHFYVFGRVKERLDNVNKYFFELEGLVVHNPLNKGVQSNLQREFLEVWAKNIEFQEKMEFKGFQLSADLIFIAVEYIVGLVVLHSGNFNITEKLYTSLEKTMASYKEFPNIKHISSKLNLLIPEVYVLISRGFVNEIDFERAQEYLSKAFSRTHQNYNAWILKSLIDFTHHKDSNSALKSVREAKKYTKVDGTWRYNEAFLMMFNGEYEQAFRIYESICKITFPDEEGIINQVIEFNINYTKEKPEFSQSYFILGYLFYKKLINYPEAILFFEKYIEIANPKSQRFIYDKALVYKRELEREMQLT